MFIRKLMFIVAAIILFLPGYTAFGVGNHAIADASSSSLALFPEPEQHFKNKNGDHAQKNVDRPKNVIFMVGDGMGLGQMEIARLFEHGKNGRLFMESLPNVALAHTYSDDNMVTDSAAGGTALATGEKTNNGMISVSPDKKEMASILKKFKQDGRQVGVISTNKVTDATPAAFTACVPNRWEGQSEIARQQLAGDIDVILGGGSQYFKPENQDGVDLIGKFKEKGYSFATNRTEMAEANGNKLLGLFHPDNMNFTVDRAEVKSEEPTLKEMTAKGIEVLSKGNNGFFMMVEGARIDHASHAADLTSVWKETIEFDQSVKYATEWAKENGDTLVVVLADHETMGISATEAMDIEALKKIGVSHEFMANQLKKVDRSNEYSAESIRNVFKTYADIDITEDEIRQFNENVKDKRGKVYPTRQVGWEIGSIIANHYHGGTLNSPTRSLSSTGGHTGNLVPVFAYGAGSEKFEGVLDNVDIPKIIAKLMGYEL
ncbi:alkaline phosphatase [Mesobacillus persicus]|uniref:Alkaline phosphatase n=1 Tax=Mesobacillus persicus TaxID=930146 RepID=A0A1H8G8A0_9BACI|nr:alkaline phosphatase [Mesobacillus persicus]SEN40223.1 alkaline phosphatase [Mesobacillus persicus]